MGGGGQEVMGEEMAPKGLGCLWMALRKVLRRLVGGGCGWGVEGLDEGLEEGEDDGEESDEGKGEGGGQKISDTKRNSRMEDGLIFLLALVTL